MLVRIVEEWRRDGELIRPGTLINIPDDEAAVLIEQGVAVPSVGIEAVERR